MKSRVVYQTVQHKQEELAEFLNPFFAREEARQTALRYTCALMSRAERKNSWQLAEETGLKNPYCFQHLLARALWQAGAVRDRLQSEISDQKEGGILAIDETGFLKKGKQSAGVARQYSGTAGRIENCQIGVFLSYATKEKHILIDRELYIPKEWFKDKERCDKAKIPSEVRFKTKPQLALSMLERALSHGILPSWVVGDEVYGVLRSYLEQKKCPYVLAVASNYSISLGLSQYKVSALPVETRNWERLSAGQGTKGERYYEWQRREINSISPKGWKRWLLLRKNLKQVTYSIAFCRNEVSLQEMVNAAGSRWTIEECFETAKGEVGLDHYEVRSYKGWYRHMTLCILALAFLSKLQREFNQLDKKKPTSMQEFLKRRDLI